AAAGRRVARRSFGRSLGGAATSRASEAPRAKQATAIQSFTWPSPARQSEPAPQPPASVMPTPKSNPPASEPSPAAGNTPPLLSLRAVNFKVLKAHLHPATAT